MNILEVFNKGEKAVREGLLCRCWKAARSPGVFYSGNDKATSFISLTRVLMGLAGGSLER